MGWALGNMWYDKYQGPPPVKTPLESLFMLVALRRMEANLLSTRALVHASLTPESHIKPAVKAYTEYADVMMPFLATAQDLDRQKAREALLKFVKVRAKIDAKYIYKKQAQKLAERGIVAGGKFNLRSRTPGL